MFDRVVPGPRTSRAWDAALLAQAVTVGPGPVAIGLLEQVDPDRLSGHDRVAFLSAWQAQAAWVTARSYAAILPVAGTEPAADPDPDQLEESGEALPFGPFGCVEEARHAEVAAACRLSTTAASDRIATARFLHGPGAPVAGLLESGAWGYGHLRAVVSETAELSPDLIEKVVQTVVAEALPDVDGVPSRYAEETPGRLRHRIRRTILRIDAAAAADRANKRKRERSLRISPLPDFRAKITLEASQPMASWAWRQFDTWARARQATLKDPAADLGALLGPCTCPDSDGDTAETGTGTDTGAGGARSAGLVGTLAALRGYRQAAGSGTGVPGSGAATGPTRDREHRLGCPHHPDTTLEALRADAVIEAARLLMRTLGHDTNDGPLTTGTSTATTASGTPNSAAAGEGEGRATAGTKGAATGGGAVANGGAGSGGAGAGTGAGSPGAGSAGGGSTGRGRSWSTAVVIVDAATLLGLADNPGWVPGHGWVPAPLARELAASADTWRAFLTDHGRLVATGTTRYRPSDRLRELVTARDTTCTFPGCTIPSVHTDLDHATEFNGGNTTAANLHPACRRHHRIKTHSDWSAAPDPGSGRIRWTSPTGHTYPTPPDPIWDTGPPHIDAIPESPSSTDPPVSALETWLATHLAA